MGRNRDEICAPSEEIRFLNSRRCWLALALWDRLALDQFWGPHLPARRQGTRWLDLLKVQVCYRLIDQGSDPEAPKLLRDLLATLVDRNPVRFRYAPQHAGERVVFERLPKECEC